MNNLFNLCLATLVTMMLPAILAAQAGGDFTIKQSVIAGGGANSISGNFGVTGTIAQPNAGDNSTGGQFSLKSGFWQAFLAPTAASVSVSGRVQAAGGKGIRNVGVTMTNQNGETQTVLTGAFGYFRFVEVPVGETYIFSVRSRRFQFSSGTRILFVVEEISDLVFIADDPGLLLEP